MKYQTESGKVSGLAVALLLIGVAIIGLFVAPTISNGNETGRLEAEINRVTEETSVEPSSVECRNVESANICYAEHSGTPSSIKKMLENSSYSVESTKRESVSASNQSTLVRVDSETESSVGVITLKFKEINVTL